jgi:hypothetical protein
MLWVQQFDYSESCIVGHAFMIYLNLLQMSARVIIIIGLSADTRNG